jgi:hypothetical protein
MMKRFLICIICAVLLRQTVAAQELQAKVTVLSQQISSNVDKSIFSTLQTQLTNLLNNRKWTKDVYQPQERIPCSFLLNVQSVVSTGEYKATLTIQAARPVFNSVYQAAMINYQDADVTFKYAAFQPIDFNENNVQGTDPLSANLSAIFAYYVYTILAFNYDSFSPKGGAPYFQKAQNIVTNAPDANDISGWKPFDGLRNRYWLANNMNDNTFNILHSVIYGYYRNGLDSMYDQPLTAQQNILTALSTLGDFNRLNSNTMAVQFFVQGKSDEFIGIFQQASPAIKSRVLSTLTQIDVANISKYQSALQ